MRTRELENMIEYWSHCHECGARMVTVRGGTVCPSCGFELEDPDDEAVLEIGRFEQRRQDRFRAAYDLFDGFAGEAA
ncbi:MAG: hypothetical protein D6806_13075 [Deltaproteobacteria bacterium]|nr:MAG: hypothetical protein D6806_13075 [Deltaproteobacteria bacterium]